MNQLLFDILETVRLNTPGVMARQIDMSHFLYLNVSGIPKEIPMNGKSRSLLFDKNYHGNFFLEPYEP
jgi:beta-galactosidase